MTAPAPTGLTTAEARARLAADGPNELPGSRPRSFSRIALEVAQEPMFLLLVGCGVIYLLIGEPEEAAMLLGFVVVVMAITMLEERRTEHALDALRQLSSPRALVIRDGRRERVPGSEVVRGDLVVLTEGDRVPADALLLDASHLTVDESLLTGESVPVRKRAARGDEGMARPGGEESPAVFSGTLVVAGAGIGWVTATGGRSEIGRIGRSLGEIGPSRSPLQIEADRLVRRFALIAVGLCVAVAVIYGATRGDWLGALLAGIALAMSLLPEEFPVILTVFLSLGAWRMSRHRVLTRRIASVETLGSATVLCVDKTGTLTENRMTVRELVTQEGERIPVGDALLPERVHPLVEFALLATRRDPFDPMERAINQLGLEGRVDPAHLHGDWVMVREYPLSPQLLAMSQVWEERAGGARVIAAKGAPEAICTLCHVAPEVQAALLTRVGELAADGLRVLAVARARLTHDHRTLGAALPERQHDFEFELLGLIGLADPVRAGVPEAVAACRRAGIRVLMITGDYPATAEVIARRIGLPEEQELLTGPALDALSDDELRRRIPQVKVVARAVPEQKLRIVRALQANGEVVAMTGDGVNDAPALRAAEIGVAMGGRGTDVAREAADLVVADDDFSSIVEGVRSGRRIYDNLRHALSYTVAVHLPIAGMALLPVLLGWPLILLPAHIAFLELIINPSCSVVFEAEPAGPHTMAGRPHRRDEPLFGREALRRSLWQGTLVLLLVAGASLAAFAAGMSENQLRALAFYTLVLGNLALIVLNRSHSRSIVQTMRRPNPALWAVLAGAGTALTLVLSVPLLRELFRFEWPGGGPLALCAAGTAALLVIVDVTPRLAALLRTRGR